MNEKDKDSQMTPIRDGRGNFLSVGNEIVFTGVNKMTHITGRVIGFDPGGISLLDSNSKPRETMMKLRVVFDVTLSIPPQAPNIPDIFRIVNPDSEVILGKILDSNMPKIQ